MYEPVGALNKSPLVSATAAAVSVAQDPFLQETACEIARLSNVVATGSPGGNCTRTDPRKRGATAGIGLEHIVGPLRGYVWHRQHPWAIPLGVVAVLGLVYWAGRESAL